jgi:hypothetical protein
MSMLHNKVNNINVYHMEKCTFQVRDQQDGAAMSAAVHHGES